MNRHILPPLHFPHPHATLEQALKLCKSSFLSVAAFSMFINLAMLIPAIYMLQVYDRVVVGNSLPTLYVLTLLMLVFMAAMGLLDWARQDIMRRVANRLDILLATPLFDVGYRQAVFSGGLVSGAQPLHDLKVIRQFVSNNGLFAFFDAPWVPLYLIVMFAFDVWIGVAGVLSALLLIAITVANERLTRKSLKESGQEYEEANASLNRLYRNGEVIAAMGMLGHIRQRWLNRIKSAMLKQNAAADTSSMLTALSKTLRIVIQSLILGLGAYLAIKQEISPGMMIAGSILLGRALAPIDQMLGIWKQFAEAREQYKRLNASLHNDHLLESDMSLPAPQGELLVDNITVTAPGSNTVLLHDIHFQVRAGTITGIIGPSAAGKSTLARALLGIWPCAKGSVRLDGADIFTWNKAELGPYIGYLPQDIELFEGSIGDNIARFAPRDPDKVVAAARNAGIHEMILRLPQGYDTRLGNGGANLSGGQRQRLGIARAIYGSPRLVVLDEPNANLDHQGEMALLDTLQMLRRDGASVFIITHKTNVLAAVDKLLVLADGSLSMFGPRDAVLSELNRHAPPPKLKEVV